MGNKNSSAGFQYGEGATKQEALANFRRKVEMNGGRVYCDKDNVCYTVDANGVRFRIHFTKLATSDGRTYYSVTEGVTF